MTLPATYEKTVLDHITELAEALTPISDIALLLNLDVNELRTFISNTGTAASIAYRTGKARGMLAVRQAALKKAADGDLSATTVVHHFHSIMEDDENL
jgi:hypothetical protein